MGIDKFYRRGVFPAIALGGISDLYSYLLSMQGKVYFVENNAGSDSNNGLSWDTAFKTLTYALAISHADIAASSKGWASRNTIFCKGDAIVENLTKLARKTNIVGVGSCDDWPTCRILGTHIIEARSSVPTDYMGCHFYNIEFMNDSADINITIPANQNGIEFHNCIFSMAAGATHAIKATESWRMKIINCKFRPDDDGNKFATATIWLLGTTVGGIEIIGNQIYGAIGIDCDITNAIDGLVKDNLIVATTLIIDDASQDLIFADNTLVTAMANDTTPQEVCNVNVKLAVRNMLTGDTKTVAYPLVALT